MAYQTGRHAGSWPRKRCSSTDPIQQIVDYGYQVWIHWRKANHPRYLSMESSESKQTRIHGTAVAYVIIDDMGVPHRVDLGTVSTDWGVPDKPVEEEQMSCLGSFSATFSVEPHDQHAREEFIGAYAEEYIWAPARQGRSAVMLKPPTGYMRGPLTEEECRRYLVQDKPRGPRKGKGQRKANRQERWR